MLLKDQFVDRPTLAPAAQPSRVVVEGRVSSLGELGS
jgi:hypothetical protein